jgi:phosphomannomutase
VVTAVRPRTVRRTLRKLFARLPCRLSEVETETSPTSRLKLEALRNRIERRITQRSAHLGILIDDDGSRCEFFNELGEQISQDAISIFLARIIRSELPRAGLVVDNSLFRENPVHETSSLSDAVRADGSAGSVARAMLHTKAVLGIERNDRYWFRENYPACDAVLALGRVLQGLSQSDAACSTRIDFSTGDSDHR